MRTLTLGFVLRRGLLAGLIAGLLAALVALLLVEPAIDAALVVEEARSTGESGGHEHELVGRALQVVGGMVAAVLVAVSLGLVLAVVFARVRHRLPGGTDLARAAVLAGCGFVAVSLLPALKYPANPPGVGDPATVTARTWQYFSLIIAAVGFTWLAFLVRDGLAGRGWSAPHAAAGAVLAGVLGNLLVLVAWPATPDVVPADVPAGLLWEFRLASVAELATLWAGLGFAFGLLLTPRKASGGSAADRAADPATTAPPAAG
jgi:predicted cobalt transporter CbtA